MDLFDAIREERARRREVMSSSTRLYVATEYKSVNGKLTIVQKKDGSGPLTYQTTVVNESAQQLVEQFSIRWEHAQQHSAGELKRIAAGVRLLGSENPDEPAQTQVAIAQACVNKVKAGGDKWAAGGFSMLTWHEDPNVRGTFGAQRGRWASTRNDGASDHATAAAGVFFPKDTPAPPDLVRGATSFLDVWSQLGGKQDQSTIKPPEVIAREWMEDGLAWVGPIPGVRRVMFFRHVSDAATLQTAYEAAVKVFADIRAGRIQSLDAGMSDTIPLPSSVFVDGSSNKVRELFSALGVMKLATVLA